MSECALRYPASMLAEKAWITVDDIILLRRHMFPVGLTSVDDARQLLVLHRSAAKKCAEWDNWFIEMMTAFIVVHSYPQFSLDDLNADWLIASISSKGCALTSAELEVVLHAMELASAVPDQLSAFALDQLRIALQTRTGAYASRRRSKRAGIAAEDIEFIYRILRGSLFDGKMTLSRREVSVLDRIDAIVCNAVNHPAWHDLRRSVMVRTPDGQASAGPWLTMMVDDISLDEAA